MSFPISRFSDTAPLSNLLVWEHPALITRETVTIAGGSGSPRELKAGEVLGQRSSDSTYVALDPSASDGSEVARAVLLEDATAPDGTDVEALAAVREAVVVGDSLVWPSGITDAQRTSAVQQLDENRRIVVRDATA